MTLDSLTNKLWQGTKSFLKKGITTLTMIAFLSNPGTIRYSVDGVIRINDLSKSKKELVYDTSINYIKQFEKGNLKKQTWNTQTRIAKLSALELKDANKLYVEDLRSLFYGVIKDKIDFNTIKDNWQLLTIADAHHPDPSYLQKAKFDKIWNDFVYQLNKNYVNNPNFENALLKTAEEFIFELPEGNYDLNLDWDLVDKAYELTDLGIYTCINDDAVNKLKKLSINFINNSHNTLGYYFTGDIDICKLYLLTHPKESIEKFKHAKLDLNDKISYDLNGIIELKESVVKSPMVYNELMKLSAKNNIDPAILNYVVSAPFIYGEKTTEVPLPIEFEIKLPFTKDEELKDEEERLIERVKNSLKNQNGKIKYLPNQLIWDSRISDSQKIAETSELYQNAFVEKKDAALDFILRDDAFLEELPEKFSLVALGCGDGYYESRLLNYLTKAGKTIDKIAFIDYDVTVMNEAREIIKLYSSYDALAYHGLINSFSIDSLKKSLAKDIPVVYFTQGIINFDGVTEFEDQFYQGIVDSLKPGDKLITGKKLMTDDEPKEMYDSSQKFGIKELELLGLNPNKWSFNGITKDSEKKEYIGSFICDEIDGFDGVTFEPGNKLVYLKSSRKPISELVDANLLYRMPASDLHGYEIVLLERNIID